jgi:hypothetical protein
MCLVSSAWRPTGVSSRHVNPALRIQYLKSIPAFLYLLVTSTSESRLWDRNPFLLRRRNCINYRCTKHMQLSVKLMPRLRGVMQICVTWSSFSLFSGRGPGCQFCSSQCSQTISSWHSATGAPVSHMFRSGSPAWIAPAALARSHTSAQGAYYRNRRKLIWLELKDGGLDWVPAPAHRGPRAHERRRGSALNDLPAGCWRDRHGR